MNKEQTYSEAYAALEKLVARIEEEDIELDELAGKVEEANQLVKYCDAKLRTIEADIKEKINS
jgi:exodeoxyribonuclease VII small subunit